MWISSRRGEVDAVDLVDDVAQQVAALHAVVDALEDGGDHVAPVAAVRALQSGAGRRTGPGPRAVGPDRFVVVDERDQLVAGDAVLLRRPIAPAVRRLDGGAEVSPLSVRLLLAQLLQVVEELEEHDPGEHRQAVEVAVQPLVLAHDSRADLTMLPSCCAVVSVGTALRARRPVVGIACGSSASCAFSVVVSVVAISSPYPS